MLLRLVQEHRADEVVIGLRGQFARYADLTDPKASLAFKLNLPAEYVLIHRVLLGGIAVMCQPDAHVPMRETLQTWLPSFD